MSLLPRIDLANALDHCPIDVRVSDPNTLRVAGGWFSEHPDTPNVSQELLDTIEKAVQTLEYIIQRHAYGRILHHAWLKNADGTPRRCHVNGKAKFWKTRPLDFRVPVKHGLRDCFDITWDNLIQWSPNPN